MANIYKSILIASIAIFSLTHCKPEQEIVAVDPCESDSYADFNGVYNFTELTVNGEDQQAYLDTVLSYNELTMTTTFIHDEYWDQGKAHIRLHSRAQAEYLTNWVSCETFTAFESDELVPAVPGYYFYLEKEWTFTHLSENTISVTIADVVSTDPEILTGTYVFTLKKQ